MKLHTARVGLLSLLLGASCGVNKGEGITGAFMMGFEPLPEQVTSTHHLWFLPDGRLVTRSEGSSGEMEVWNEDWTLSHTFAANQIATGHERIVVLDQGQLFSGVDGTNLQPLAPPTETGWLRQVRGAADGRIVLTNIDVREAGLSSNSGRAKETVCGPNSGTAQFSTDSVGAFYGTRLSIA